jgi:transcriptional regulator PpsR
MDGTLSRSTLQPFSKPKKYLAGLDTDLAAVIIAAAADLAIVVDGAGTVCDVASSNELMSIDAPRRWVGMPLTACVSPDSTSKIESLLAEGREQKISGWRQVNHPLYGNTDIPILYSSILIGKDGELLCLGRDLRPMATLQQKLLQAQQMMEREYARLRQSETRYRLLFQLCAEAVIVCEAASQKIVEVNPAASDLIGTGQKRLVGRHFPEGFESESTAAIEGMLATVRAAGRADAVMGTISQSQKQVLIQASLFRQENMGHILVRIIGAPNSENPTDAQIQQSLSLIEQMPDGFVVTNAQGRIRSANLAFLDLAEISSEEQVRGEELGRWIGRPGVDFPVLLNNLREHGSVKLFSSVLRGEYGTGTEVEISAASTNNEADQWIGFTIRATQARIKPRNQRAQELPRSLDQLTELIGRVPLKELVRETTDVIERMCIESALLLTGDNRASAAEMLGLSRQSLYVKLHRYGLGDLPGTETEE